MTFKKDITVLGVDRIRQLDALIQQAAEKYLKAFILAYDLEFRPIHNLLELIEICKQKEEKYDSQPTPLYLPWING